MSTHEQPRFEHEADDTPEEVSVDNVLELIEGTALSIELASQQGEERLRGLEEPSREDLIAIMEYEASVEEAKIDSKIQSANANLLRDLKQRIIELRESRGITPEGTA